MSDPAELSWRTEKRKVADLIPFEDNPRKMTEDQVNRLRASMVKYNLVELPVIDTDNQIVAGHQRIKILQMIVRNEEEIEVRVPNRKLTDEEFREYNVGSNKWGGEFDWDVLAHFDPIMLTDIGFSPDELNFHFNPDTTTETDEKDKVKMSMTYTCPACGHEFTPGKKQEEIARV